MCIWHVDAKRNSQLDSEKLKSISVNIWDELTPERDTGFWWTYAYVEEDKFSDEEQKSVLESLLVHLQTSQNLLSHIKYDLIWYESATDYPKLIGTEYESALYKRWELRIHYVTYEVLEALVENLTKQKIRHRGQLLSIYSES